MGKVFHAIGDISTSIFDTFPAFGPYINMFFAAAIAFGILYWTIYEHKVGNKGGDNYLSR